MKTTKDVVLEYFNAFDKNKGWENLTNYELVLPTNGKMNLEVAETISVKGQKIDSFEIYFDTVKFNEFMAKMNNN